MAKIKTNPKKLKEILKGKSKKNSGKSKNLVTVENVKVKGGGTDFEVGSFGFF